MATRPEKLRVFAPAKINLFLHVVGKRGDGFHALQSLVVFADIGDELRAELSGDITLEIDGPFAAGLAGEADNLVLRAARAVQDRLGTRAGARFRLTKNLPVASGIGGGSADAAAAMRAFLALHGEMERQSLLSLAAALGSDIPVCVSSAPSLMEGRGEQLREIAPLPQCHIVLVNPGIAVSTAEVFRGLAVKNNPPAPALPETLGSFDELVVYLRGTRNDLEAPARSIAPAIGEAIAALEHQDAALARMSGSGATCFGLFADADTARVAGEAISRAQPRWWVKAGALADADRAAAIASA